MQVKKRNGLLEPVELNKITKRIEQLCSLVPELKEVDAILVATRVVAGLFDGVTTVLLDQLTTETAASLTTRDPQYNRLAARVAVSNLHKQTHSRFSDCVQELHEHQHPVTKAQGVIDPELYRFVMKNKAVIDEAIVTERDYLYSFFGFKTLERSYLLRCHGVIVERPGYMLMRVALGIHGENLSEALQSYHDMSLQLLTHATPTLFNSGTKRPQLASCFLLGMEDSIEGIYKTLSDTAFISKHAGGLGLHVHDIRAAGSHISGTGGASNGLVPLLRVFNESSRLIDQGGGKRPGSIAVYLEPHHADILDFLEIRLNSGSEQRRARDLFTALWISDLFMERVEANAEWSLFCPHECSGLSEVYGSEYRELYERYEEQGRARRVLPAMAVWTAMVVSMAETGTPYVVNKDSVNRKSPQQNLGTIKSSNLCAEVTLYTSPAEVAVCNLASINLSSHVKDGEYDFQGLADVASRVTYSLNQVIDRTYYPIPEARRSNLTHRPIGVGVQGLADVFFKLRLPFESAKALELSRDMAEAVYYGCVRQSVALARAHGAYRSYSGSPASEGKLQFHLWDTLPSSGNFDWTELLKEVTKYGLRNSTLTCCMPTASTSAILGRTEAVEALCSNCYVRRTNSGEYILLNEYLVSDLQKLGKWNPECVNQLIADEGSIQGMDLPQELKDLYKTTWEIRQRVIIDQAAARGPYVCMSQSMNLFIADPTLSKVSSALFYGWRKGLKTLVYYTRSRSKASPIQFTVDKTLADKTRAEAEESTKQAQLSCTREMMEQGCESCSG